MKRKILSCIAFSFSVLVNTAYAAVFPLDPLSVDEMQTAACAVRADINYDVNPDQWLFDKIELLEPAKAAVLAYKANPTPGNKPDRQALVNVWNRAEDKYYTYVFNFDASAIAAKKQKNLSKKQKETLVNNQLQGTRIKGAHPRLTFTEFGGAVGTILGTPDNNYMDGLPEFYAAMAARGFTDRAEVAANVSFDCPLDGRLKNSCGNNCSNETPNWDTPTHKARMVYLTPYWDGFFSFSYYTQPIDQITIFIDLNSDPLNYKVVDHGIHDGYYPINQDTFCTATVDGPCCFNRGARGTLGNMNVTVENPICIDENDPYKITWENWSFRYAPHARLGLVLYDITYNDKHYNACDVTNADYCNGTVPPVTPTERSILYRASVDGVLSIYGDPSVPFVNHAFYDMDGEFPPVVFSSQLKKGVDVPEYATLASLNSFDDGGNCGCKPNFVGFYEQDGGLLWRHFDQFIAFPNPTTFGRRGRELVVNFACSIGNYDFTYYYIFRQDGSIKVEVKLTGQMEFKQASVKDLNEVPRVKALHDGGDEFKYSPFVGHYVAAPNHSHYFNFRLDFNVDGLKNKVFEHDTVVDNGQCGTVWHTEEHEVKCGYSDYDIEKNRMWVIENTDPAKKTCLGIPPAYALIPQTHAGLVFRNCARIAKRATYLKHPLFVVPYKEGELDTFGKYPCEASSDNAPDDVPENKGLGWFLDNCLSTPSDGYNPVVYYTMGHAHSPHPEQNPIMNTETISFLITPHGFFTENPAMDVDADKFTGSATNACAFTPAECTDPCTLFCPPASCP